MTRLLGFVLVAAFIGLVTSGCEKPTAPDSPTPPAATRSNSENRRGAPPAVSKKTAITQGGEAQLPAAVTPASAVSDSVNQTVSDIPIQYMDPQLQAALRKYPATGDRDERSIMVSDVAKLADSGVPKPQVAATLGQMFRQKTSVEVMTDILDELSTLEDPSSLAQIVQGLDSNLPDEVRLAAIDALETLDDPRAIAQLKQLLSDRSQQVREAAQSALETLSKQ